ncbi:hypothetical protein ACKWTF_016761 [Chironomus riparius]
MKVLFVFVCVLFALSAEGKWRAKKEENEDNLPINEDLKVIHISNGKPFFFGSHHHSSSDEHSHIPHVIKLFKWVKKILGICGSPSCEHKGQSSSSSFGAHSNVNSFIPNHGVQHSYVYGPSTPVHGYGGYVPVVENQLSVEQHHHHQHQCWKMFQWFCDLFY